MPDDELGRDPDLTVGGLSLWVHGREFPDSTDFWDSNWLHVTATMVASGARVETTGPILHVSELASFAEALSAMADTMAGEAMLDCMEPNLSLSLRVHGLGHVSGQVSITPDPIDQQHSFTLGALDQTYLGPLLHDCEQILQRFPVRGSHQD